MNTCKVCGKEYLFSSNLSRHMNIHKNKKDVCEVCEKSFARKDVLKRHMATIHKLITRKKNLNTSLETAHTSVYEEDSCDKSTHNINNHKEINRLRDKSFSREDDKVYRYINFERDDVNEDNAIRSQELDAWVVEDPSALVDAIRINRHLGMDYQIYVDKLRAMNIIE